MKTTIKTLILDNLLGKQIYIYIYDDYRGGFMYDTILSHLGDSHYYDQEDFICKGIATIIDTYIDVHAQLQLVLSIDGKKVQIHINTNVDIEFVENI